MPKSNNKRRGKKAKGPTQPKVRVDQTAEGDDTLVDIVEVRDAAQGFFERNQNTIVGVAAALAVLIGGYLIYKKLVMEPKQTEAFEQMSQALYQFERDSFALALQNPGAGFEGLEDIADNYSGTDAGNLSKYYAGIAHLNLGAFDKAIDYLEDFSAAGTITPIMKAGALGDAYAENNEMDKALSSYKKASSVEDNEFLNSYYLKKYGMLLLSQGKTAEAQEAFERIVKEFPNSLDASEVQRYITK